MRKKNIQLDFHREKIFDRAFTGNLLLNFDINFIKYMIYLIQIQSGSICI